MSEGGVVKPTRRGRHRLWACADCGPADLIGPMLRDDIWLSIARKDEFLCLPCIERRLGRPLTENDLTGCRLNEGCPEFLARRRLANQFHDVLLRELARLAPSGTDRSLVNNAVCEAMIRLMAELLVSTKPDLPATEVKRLTALFRNLLKTAIAERSGRWREFDPANEDAQAFAFGRRRLDRRT